MDHERLVGGYLLANQGASLAQAVMKSLITTSYDGGDPSPTYERILCSMSNQMLNDQTWSSPENQTTHVTGVLVADELRRCGR